MFEKKELKRLLPIAIFFISYTAMFILAASTFLYILPFLIGLFVSAAVQPIVNFAEKKIKISHAVASLFISITANIILLTALFFISIFIFREVSNFLVNLSSGDFMFLEEPIANISNRLSSFFKKYDLTFNTPDMPELISMIRDSMDLIIGFLKTLLRLITSLPAIITLLIVTCFSTYFFTRDLGKIKGWVRSTLSDAAAFHVRSAAENSDGISKKYFLSYMLIYFLTFCETVVIMFILDIPYPLTIALATSVADLIPLLGPAIVFFPIATYQLLLGNYHSAIGLIIGYVIITMIRQIIEPRLVSTMIRVHPLCMLAGIYFSLIAGNFWLLIYIVGLCLIYSALSQTGALPKISIKKHT